MVISVKMVRGTCVILYLTCILGFMFLFLEPALGEHMHSHEHDESPKYRYSREANEQHLHEHQHSHIHEPVDHGKAHHSHHHSHQHSHDHYHEEPTPAEKRSSQSVPKSRSAPTGGRLWLQALGATLLISLAPFFILFFIPLDNALEQKHGLKILLAFASGGLLGDAFLHLIPHALMAQNGNSSEAGHSHSHSHTHGHSHGEGEEHDLSVGLWVLCGILTFLVVEKFVRIVKGSHGHSHGPHGAKPDDHKGDDEQTEMDKGDSGGDVQTTANEKSDDAAGDGEKEEEKNLIPSNEKGIEEFQVAGYLNLAADFAHNFTDGLAIGASFLAGETMGISTTIMVLLHEVPHEIGDFAILIRSGCSKRKAILLQLVTAVGALAGTVCSLLAEGDDLASSWILPFTAGGFIYIATVSVLPELLEDSKLWHSVCEVSALVAGVILMVFIAKFE